MREIKVVESAKPTYFYKQRITLSLQEPRMLSRSARPTTCWQKLNFIFMNMFLLECNYVNTRIIVFLLHYKLFLQRARALFHNHVSTVAQSRQTKPTSCGGHLRRHLKAPKNSSCISCGFDGHRRFRYTLGQGGES